jgi:hypothetical protein
MRFIFLLLAAGQVFAAPKTIYQWDHQGIKYFSSTPRPKGYYGEALKVGAVTAWVRRPKDKLLGKLPAVVVVGFEPPEPMRPAVLAHFEGPYAPLLSGTAWGLLMDAGKLKSASRETSEAVAGIVAALRARPDVEGDRVCAAGVGSGVPYALRAAADDPSISCLILVQGFDDVAEATAHRLRSQGSWRPTAWLVSRLLRIIVRPPQPLREIARLRKDLPVLFLEAQDEVYVPASAREGLWEGLKNAGIQADRVTLKGRGDLGAPPAPLLREASETVGAWLAKTRQPIARE